MKKQIPNILTLLNLVSGCIASVNALEANFYGVAVWVSAAALFDFFDGLAARALNASSPIGKELDSLADMVSFGLAPSLAVFVLLRDLSFYAPFALSFTTIIPYAAFAIPAFSALRLAKFNLDERQSVSFIGLPTPANGFFWISYCFGVQRLAQNHPAILYATLGFIAALSLLMVAEIPMFSLKIKKLTLRGNEKQAILILAMATLCALMGFSGIAWGILVYIGLSLFGFFTERKTTVK